MRIRPFPAIRPPADRASAVASLPYDVGELEDARVEAQRNPASFLHVERPEVDLPDGFDAGSGIHHRTASLNLKRFLDEGVLRRESAPAIYVYRLTLGGHAQTSVVATCHVDDYFADLVKKHEKTKKPVEDDRTRHVLDVGAQTGPIFLLYRDDSSITAQVARIQSGAPEVAFTASDGVRHEVWRVGASEDLVAAFDAVPCVYVADGHHRAAAASRAGAERRAANPSHTGDEEYNWFLAALFPASQLQVLAYNRTVRDLHGLSADAFLAEVRSRFAVTEHAVARPVAPRHVSMYLGGKWWGLTWREDEAADPVSRLDVAVLQDRLLEPVLGVTDPRTNARMEYLGGFRSVEELVRRVDSGRAAVGFSMHPTTVDQLMAIADAGQVMPPKSTWFEPKLRSGLFVHALD